MALRAEARSNFERGVKWQTAGNPAFLATRGTIMAAVADNEIEKAIHDRFQKAGVHQDEIRAIVERANVRLVGTLQFETQRGGILKLVSSVDGVQRVDDQLMVKTIKRK
jgi:osmotically-inducible protein OsmY